VSSGRFHKNNGRAGARGSLRLFGIGDRVRKVTPSTLGMGSNSRLARGRDRVCLFGIQARSLGVGSGVARCIANVVSDAVQIVGRRADNNVLLCFS